MQSDDQGLDPKIRSSEMFTAFEKIGKFAKFASRETGPFCFMALLMAHGAVPGAVALPVPAERHLVASAVNALKVERYGFMDLLVDAGAVPQSSAQGLPSHRHKFVEARHKIALLTGELTREMKFEGYDFMDLLADNGLTPHLNAANDNYRRPRLIPPRAA